jgi:hypothetical protein
MDYNLHRGRMKLAASNYQIEIREKNYGKE